MQFVSGGSPTIPGSGKLPAATDPAGLPVYVFTCVLQSCVFSPASAVTVIMIPVVLLTWRGTATSIVLTRAGASALHAGRVLHHVDWDDLQRIERVEYLGNTRFKLVHHDTEFLTVESEIEDGADLVEQAFALSGIPRQSGGTDQV